MYSTSIDSCQAILSFIFTPHGMVAHWYSCVQNMIWLVCCNIFSLMVFRLHHFCPTYCTIWFSLLQNTPYRIKQLSMCINSNWFSLIPITCRFQRASFNSSWFSLVPITCRYTFLCYRKRKVLALC